MPKQALGWFPLGLGLVVEDEPSELPCNHMLQLCTVLASYPGSRGGGGKREPGTDRLRMRLNNSNFCCLGTRLVQC